MKKNLNDERAGRLTNFRVDQIDHVRRGENVPLTVGHLARRLRVLLWQRTRTRSLKVEGVFQFEITSNARAFAQFHRVKSDLSKRNVEVKGSISISTLLSFDVRNSPPDIVANRRTFRE